MKLDQLVKLYGRQEDVAELAALRAELSQLRIEREEGAEIAADLTARAEAAEARCKAAEKKTKIVTVQDGDDEFDLVCSECGTSMCADEETFSFCPYCGLEIERGAAK